MPSPLRIAVLGTGSIGSTFAFQLARGGQHDVTAIARPGSARLAQLQRDNGIMRIDGEIASVRIADNLDEQVTYDLILVTMLAHQVQPLLPTLRRSAARWIQFMFNTLEPERLGEAVGPERCSFGMPFVQATLKADGRLEAKIGAAGQKTKMNDHRWVDLFQTAGLPAVFEAEMLLWLRCHVPLCVAFESISAAGVKRGGGASWSEAMLVARGMQEAFTLLKRLGFPLYPSGKRVLHRLPTPAAATMLWSMSRIRSFRELLATGAGECRALIDVLVQAGQQVEPGVSLTRITAMKP